MNIVLRISLGALVLYASAGIAQTVDLLDLSDQLDKGDQREVATLVTNGQRCVQARDFACAEAILRKIKSTSSLPASKVQEQRLRLLLSAEKRAVEDEALALRESRQREARLALRERERAERQAVEAQEREEEVGTPIDTGAAIAATANSVFQNAAKFGAAAQRQQQAIFANAREVQRQQQAVQAEQDRRREAENQRVADERRTRAETRRENEQRELATVARERTALERTRQAEEEVRQVAAREHAEVESRKRSAEETRRRGEQQKADRLATQEQIRKQAQGEVTAYHAALLRGIRMKATKCPDGEGHYYATGSIPALKEPAGAACINVTFEARCPDSRPPIRGVADNYIGMAGCFGDTYKIEPKPTCDAKDVRIEVTSVSSCT